MSENKTKIAFLGLSESGRGLLETTYNHPKAKILAVADMNSELASRWGQRFECDSFDDYRQLLLQTTPDLLVVSEPLYKSSEFINTAMGKNINILKFAPPARNIDEAIGLISMAQKNNTTYIPANMDAFTPAVRQFIEVFNELKESELSMNILNISATLPTDTSDAVNRWMRDPKIAGGGVLLCDFYSYVYLVIELFGLPQKIFAQRMINAPDKQQRLSLAEDCITLNLKYSDTLAVSLSAIRVSGEKSLRIEAKGADFCYFSDLDGFKLDNYATKTHRGGSFLDQENAYSEMLTEILKNLQPESKISNIPYQNMINTMATIETAYVSTRTDSPEEPSRIIQLRSSEISALKIQL